MGMAELRHELVQVVRPFLVPVQDFLFPNRCAGCGGEVHTEERSWCQQCEKRLLRYTSALCSVCFLPLLQPKCSGCEKITRPLIVGFEYRPPLREIILSLKFQSVTSVVDSLVGACHETFLKTLSNLAPDALLPIPLAEGRAYVRGYNQAELIAQAISRRTDIAVEKNILYRIKTRRPQSKVKRENREANVAGLFAVDGEVFEKAEPKRVVIVDDIVTTGATCREATRVLETVGVDVVGWVSIAHG